MVLSTFLLELPALSTESFAFLVVVVCGLSPSPHQHDDLGAVSLIRVPVGVSLDPAS